MEPRFSEWWFIFLAYLAELVHPSFDLCEDTGASAAFFPSGHGALTGSFQEVSCSSWSGSDGGTLFNGGWLYEVNRRNISLFCRFLFERRIGRKLAIGWMRK